MTTETPDEFDHEQFEGHLTQCAIEYVADVNGPGEWKHYASGQMYRVDQDVTEGPVEMVRDSDGKRFLVEVDVTVTEKRERVTRRA